MILSFSLTFASQMGIMCYFMVILMFMPLIADNFECIYIFDNFLSSSWLIDQYILFISLLDFLSFNFLFVDLCAF